MQRNSFEDVRNVTYNIYSNRIGSTQKVAYNALQVSRISYVHSDVDLSIDLSLCSDFSVVVDVKMFTGLHNSVRDDLTDGYVESDKSFL